MYLKDFMDLDKLQKIQDMFSNATGRQQSQLTRTAII